MTLFVCNRCGVVRDRDPKYMCQITHWYAYGPKLCGGTYEPLAKDDEPQPAPPRIATTESDTEATP